MAPTVDIIIPSYNRADYLPEAIESALRQTYVKTRVTVVDDGSTDRTPEVLARYKHQVQILRQPNTGSSAARNRGLQHTDGEYVAFLDSDDTWLPGKIERQVQVMANGGACALLATNGSYIDREGRPLGRPLHQIAAGTSVLRSIWLADLIMENQIATSTALVRRDALEKAGHFRDAYRVVQDYDLWLRIATRYEVKYLNEEWIQYRYHSSNISFGNRIACCLEELDIFSKLAAEVPEHRRLITDATRKIAYQVARLHVIAGNHQLGRDYLQKSILRDPLLGRFFCHVDDPALLKVRKTLAPLFWVVAGLFPFVLQGFIARMMSRPSKQIVDAT